MAAGSVPGSGGNCLSLAWSLACDKTPSSELLTGVDMAPGLDMRSSSRLRWLKKKKKLHMAIQYKWTVINLIHNDSLRDPLIKLSELNDRHSFSDFRVHRKDLVFSVYVLLS